MADAPQPQPVASVAAQPGRSGIISDLGVAMGQGGGDPGAAGAAAQAGQPQAPPDPFANEADAEKALREAAAQGVGVAGMRPRGKYGITHASGSTPGIEARHAREAQAAQPGIGAGGRAAGPLDMMLMQMNRLEMMLAEILRRQGRF